MEEALEQRVDNDAPMGYLLVGAMRGKKSIRLTLGNGQKSTVQGGELTFSLVLNRLLLACPTEYHHNARHQPLFSV